MYLRCALVFLSKVAMQFPNRVCEGHELLQQVEIVKEREKDRPGLQTMALSLSTILRRQAPQWFNDDSEGKYANSISKKASTGAAVASLENNFDEQKFKNTSENREGKGSVESRESKGSREIKDSRDSKDQRPPVHPHQQSNPKEARDSKDKDKAVSRNSNKDTEKEIAAKGGKDTKDSSSKYSSRGVASRKEEVKANDNGRNESDIKGRDRRDEKGTTSTGSRNGRVDDKNAKDTATSSRESPHNKERTSDRVTDSSRENQSDRDGGLRKSKDESYDDNRERDSRRQESKQTDQYKKTADNRSVDGGRQSSRHSRDRSRDNQDDQRNKLSDLESTDLVGQQSKDNQKRKRTDSSDRPEKSSRNSGKNENSVPETKKGYNSSSEGGKNSRGRTDEHGNADEQRNKRDHQTMEGPLPVAVELQRDDLKSKKARREDDIASTEKAATKDVEQEPTKVVNESTDDKGKSAETQHSSKDRKEGEKKSSHKSKHKEGRKHEKGKGEDNIEPPKKNPFVNSQLSLPVETRTDNRANIPPVVLATAPLLTDYSGKNGAGLNRTSTHTPGGRSHGGGRGATPLQQQPSVPPPSYGSKSQAGMSAAGIQPSLPSQQYYAPQGSGNYHGQYSQGGRHSQQNYQGRGGRGGRGRGSR